MEHKIKKSKTIAKPKVNKGANIGKLPIADSIGEQKPEVELGVGNTLVGTSTPIIKARKWLWTWNNYTANDLLLMEQFCIELGTSGGKYTFQEEIGETGTKHLQGFWDFKNPRSFSSLKDSFPKMHIEKCINAKHSEAYCRKLASRNGKTFTNVESDEVEDDFDYTQLQVWQKQVLDIVAKKPDPRKVYWYWDNTGGCGKSSLSRSLLIKNEKSVLLAGGKGNDIKYAVATHVQSFGKTALKTCIFDFERSLDHISWSAIENVKNGAFFSGKYEASSIVFNKPHVICFANHPPDVSKLSMDRWIIVEITDELKKQHVYADDSAKDSDSCASDPAKDSLLLEEPIIVDTTLLEQNIDYNKYLDWLDSDYDAY